MFDYYCSNCRAACTTECDKTVLNQWCIVITLLLLFSASPLHLTFFSCPLFNTIICNLTYLLSFRTGVMCCGQQNLNGNNERYGQINEERKPLTPPNLAILASDVSLISSPGVLSSKMLSGCGPVSFSLWLECLLFPWASIKC